MRANMRVWVSFINRDSLETYIYKYLYTINALR